MIADDRSRSRIANDRKECCFHMIGNDRKAKSQRTFRSEEIIKAMSVDNVRDQFIETVNLSMSRISSWCSWQRFLPNFCPAVCVFAFSLKSSLSWF